MPLIRICLLGDLLEVGQTLNFFLNISIIIGFIGLWNCSNSTDLLSQGKTGTKGGFLGASQENNTEVSNQTLVYEEEDEEDSEEDIQAEVPTVLSGAHLAFTCSPSQPDLKTGNISVNCLLDAEHKREPYQDSKIYLLSKITGEVLELPVNHYVENSSWHIDFSINSYMNHKSWILALEITDQNKNYNSIFVEELELVLKEDRILTWVNPNIVHDDSIDYLAMIEGFKEEVSQKDANSIVSTQVPMEPEMQKQLIHPVVEGSEAFTNTQLVDGSLRVLVVYDMAGLPVHAAELELINQQIADLAFHENLPLRIEPMTAEEFLANETNCMTTITIAP